MLDMEESTFWDKLAKYLSSNEDEQSSNFRNYLIQDTDLKRKKAAQEASMIFGKSEKEIENLFQRINDQLDTENRLDQIPNCPD